MLNVCVKDVMDVVCYVCIVRRGAVVFNAAFCINCSFLMLNNDARVDDMEEAYSRAGLMTALEVATSVSSVYPILLR